MSATPFLPEFGPHVIVGEQFLGLCQRVVLLLRLRLLLLLLLLLRVRLAGLPPGHRGLGGHVVLRENAPHQFTRVRHELPLHGEQAVVVLDDFRHLLPFEKVLVPLAHLCERVGAGGLRLRSDEGLLLFGERAVERLMLFGERLPELV